MKTGITAVTVTYGDRKENLREVLECLESCNEINDTIVVDNNSPIDYSNFFLKNGYEKITLVKNDQNLGSAGGFHSGIREAIRKKSDYILLLDDDNLPERDAINQMQERFLELESKSRSDSFVLIPYRDEVFQKAMVSPGKTKRLIFDSFHFLGLNIFNFIVRHFLNKWKKESQHAVYIRDCSGLLWLKDFEGCAYGGLMMHRSLVNKIGLPNKDLVVYWDDVEYTRRMTLNDGKIWLLRNAVVKDIVKNYSADFLQKPFLGFLLADSDVKTYYQIRNIVYYDKYVNKRFSFLYAFNMFVFCITISILGIIFSRYRRIQIVFRAIKDGLIKKLGMPSDLELF